MTQEQFEVLMLILEFQEGVLFDNLRTSTIVFYKQGSRSDETDNPWRFLLLLCFLVCRLVAT